MSASSTNPVPPLPATPEAAPLAGASKGWRGKSRDRLKFLGARRGEGVLLWSDQVIAAAYEIDVFSLGESRTVQGALQGDFAALVSADPDSEPATRQARLRLDDGREIEIGLTEMAETFADFEATGAPADLLA
jgi:hypothetical protein